ncbi:hypothetical protein ACLEPN_15485 [Myxococcus sp. 1LA]
MSPRTSQTRLAIVRDMLRLPDCRHLASLLALVSSVLTAQAAEVSPTNRVETTPGISPEAIRKVFDSQRQTLAPCQRLVAYRRPEGGSPYHSEHSVWKPSPDTDDRVQVSLTLTPDGKIEKESRTAESFIVRAPYLDRSCVESQIQQWTFPTFPGDPDERVHVVVWARFRTTEAERAAALARLREDYTALCKVITPLSCDDRLPTPDAWSAALKRFLSERGPRLVPNMRHGVEAVLAINMFDAVELLENSMDEAMASRIDCPRFAAWKKLAPR